MTTQTDHIDIVCRARIVYDTTFPTARANAIDRLIAASCHSGAEVSGWQPGNGHYSAMILAVGVEDVTRLRQELEAAQAKFADIEALAGDGLDGVTTLALDKIINITDAARDDIRAALAMQIGDTCQ